MGKTVSKPADIPGGDFEGCVAFFSDDPNVDDPEGLCAWLEERGKDALADPNADELLTSLGVEFVSPVDTPAQDSEWVIAKNATDPEGETHRWRTDTTLLLAKDADHDRASKAEEKQIAFAPVLIPGEADKQGDVIPEPEIEKAAHGYLANHRKVDADHDLRDGRGTPVESWTLKQEWQLEKPDGTPSRTYPVGTWFMGVKFDDDTWERVKAGELTGFSIYGGARPIDVDALLQAFEKAANDGDAPTGSSASIELSKGDETTDGDTMANETDEDVDEPGDGETDVSKQELDADTVSSMLSEFGSMVDDGSIGVDATFEEFVLSLIESGSIDEGQVTGLSVLLGNGGGGDDMGEPEADEDDGMPGAPGEEEASVEMSKSEDGVEEDATDDGSTDADVAADGGDTDGDAGLPDDTPEWAKSLSKDIRGSVDDVRGDVDDLADRVDDLEKEVNGETLNERMDDDDFEKRFKSFLGVDEDADTEVVRKAFREQVEDEDGTIDASYSGLTEDDDGDDTVSKSTNRTASDNIRMAASSGDD